MSAKPIPAPRRNPLELLRDGILLTTALVLLAIVLMPLAWMILTAFKVKGTAFQLEFLPTTTVLIPAGDQKPFTMPVVEADKSYLHLETKLPDATTVAVAVKPEGGEEKLQEMTRYAEGNWAVTLGPLPSGPVTWAFVVNGQRESIDEKQKDERAWQAKPGVGAIGSSALVYRDDKEITVSVAGNAGSEYSIALGNDRVEELRRQAPASADAPTLFTAKLPARGEAAFRILEHRTFGDAVSRRYTLENFRAIVSSDDFNFARFFFNSLVVATSAGILTVLICTLAGYAFATKRFHFRDELFTVLLGSMLVPGMIFMVPQFSITLALGMMNTYAGMVVPHLANVFGLFLLRQYIGQIPKDLFNAAEIDGAREHQIFQNVVIPVCLPIMVTLFLLVFVGQWSNFLWQLIVNTGQSTVLTLPVGLQQFKGQNANEWEKIMAGACFSILPIAALFLSLQKYFLEGLTAGSVKE